MTRYYRNGWYREAITTSDAESESSRWVRNIRDGPKWVQQSIRTTPPCDTSTPTSTTSLCGGVSQWTRPAQNLFSVVLPDLSAHIDLIGDKTTNFPCISSIPNTSHSKIADLTPKILSSHSTVIFRLRGLWWVVRSLS